MLFKSIVPLPFLDKHNGGRSGGGLCSEDISGGYCGDGMGRLLWLLVVILVVVVMWW